MTAWNSTLPNRKPEDIISDKQLVKVWGNASFGMLKREVVGLAVLKCASGYYQGHTSKMIAMELGLITPKYRLSKKGKEYLWAAFGAHTNF